jgi:hypothetical protein
MKLAIIRLRTNYSKTIKINLRMLVCLSPKLTKPCPYHLNGWGNFIDQLCTLKAFIIMKVRSLVFVQTFQQFIDIYFQFFKKHFSPAEVDIQNTHYHGTSIEWDSELSDFDLIDSEFEQKVKTILNICYNSLWLENLIWRTLVYLFRFVAAHCVLRILFDLALNS